MRLRCTCLVINAPDDLRVVEQGWTEEKALEEATQIGLRSPELKRFAQEYIAAHPPKKTA